MFLSILAAVMGATSLGIGIAGGVQTKRLGEESEQLAGIQRQDILGQQKHQFGMERKRLALGQEDIEFKKGQFEESKAMTEEDIQGQIGQVKKEQMAGVISGQPEKMVESKIGRSERLERFKGGQ